MWIKRVITCSAALTGGILYLYPKCLSIYFDTKSSKNLTESDELPEYIYLPEIAGNDFDEFSAADWRKTNTPAYWKLLMLSKSKDQKVRHKAVKSLSKLSLEKWQYMMVAQACDMRTSIGLSRSFETSQHFFLLPPFRDLNVGNVHKELFHFISYLPLANDECIENFRKTVLKSGKSLLLKEFNSDLEEGDPSVLFHSQQKRKIFYDFDQQILQIFVYYSATVSYQSLMIERGILKLLLKLLKYHENEPVIQSLIGQILANFAMEEKFAKSLYMTGWIGILANWAKSSNVAVSLPAAKALANLDKDDNMHSLYDDGVYLLNPVFRQGQSEPSADIIFIHGLLGGTFWTWRQCDTQKKAQEIKDINKSDGSLYNQKSNSHNYTMCWPKDWLAQDIPSLRILSIDYKTSISNWSSYCSPEKEKYNIGKKSKEIINKLLLSHVGERPIIWIAHSMGGLIVKQILTEAFESEDNNIKLLAEKTSGIIFFSVPHKGSKVVNKISPASRILLLSTDIIQLGKDSPTLLSLHEKFKSIVMKNDIYVLSFGESKKTHWGISSSVLVSQDSSDPGVGEFHALPVDHLSTCKPVSPDSFEYSKILDFVQKNLSDIIPHEVYFKRLPRTVFEISKLLSLIP